MLYILYFLSGFSALVYEVTWVRKLSLIFGTDTLAIAGILAIFFTGLGLGAWWFGKQIAHIKNPLRLYGVLEIAIGLFALASPWFFQAGYMALVGLFLPTVLMGGTLPLIVASVGGERRESAVGWLYGLNTLGAMIGVLASGFYLIGKIGVNETIWLAAAVSGCVGVVAMALKGKGTFEENQNHGISRSLLIAVGLFGFAGMALEVLWTRVAILVMGASTYAFSLVLMAFLLGICLGSITSVRIGKRQKEFFIATAILVGISTIAMLPMIGILPKWFLDIYGSSGQEFGRFQIGMFMLLFLFMSIPTIGMGALFPLAYALAKKNVGFLYAANTFGGVLGSLAAIYLISAIGVGKSVASAGLIYIFVATAFIKTRGWVRMTILMAALVLAWQLSRFDPALLVAGFYANPDAATTDFRDEIIFAKDSISAHVAVTKDREGFLSLRINGKPDASTADDMENQVLLGQIPMLLHPEAKDALVIGLGSGITLGSVLTHPVEHVDVVEIDPVVPQAARLFDEYSNRALDNARVKLHVADGRHFLATENTQYDVISSEPSNPWQSGSSKLFTKEYFELLQKRSKDDGLVIQWVNLYAIDVARLASIFRAFLDVFPRVVAFGIPISNDLLLIGSERVIRIDVGSLTESFENERVRTDLGRVGINRPFEILSRFYLDRSALEDIAKDAQPNTDNHPIVEFTAPFYLYTPVRISPWQVIWEHISPLSSITGDVSEEDRERLTRAERYRSLRLQARNAFIEKNFDAFVRLSEEALTIEADSPSLKRNLARAYFELGTTHFVKDENEKAIEYFKKSLTFKESAEAQVNLAQSYEALGDTSQAQRHWERAIDLDETFALSYERLGLLTFQAGDLNGALVLFEKAVQLDPANTQTRTYLGQLYLMRGDEGKARREFEEALRLDPKNQEAHDLLREIKE